MKLKKIIYALSISAIVILGAAGAQAMLEGSGPQDKSSDSQHLDSLKKASSRSQEKANDARNASNESKKAVNAEKKAQKARAKADAQEKKANESKDKSDSNY